MEAPSSIITYEGEAEFQHTDLDLAYVDALALDLARILHDGGVAEAAYQPGDGSRYGVVIVPLSALRAGQPRVKDGQVWERHAIIGMKRWDGDDGADGSGFYDPSGYLVCLSERSCYPLRLEERGQGLAASYVHEHWDLSAVSAVSVAILLRAVAAHLDLQL